MVLLRSLFGPQRQVITTAKWRSFTTWEAVRFLVMRCMQCTPFTETRSPARLLTSAGPRLFRLRPEQPPRSQGGAAHFCNFFCPLAPVCCRAAAGAASGSIQKSPAQVISDLRAYLPTMQTHGPGRSRGGTCSKGRRTSALAEFCKALRRSWSAEILPRRVIRSRSALLQSTSRCRVLDQSA